MNGYKGTNGTFDKYYKLRRKNVTIYHNKPESEDKLEEGALIYLETPENPDCELHDIRHYIEIAKNKKCFVVVKKNFFRKSHPSGGGG